MRLHSEMQRDYVPRFTSRSKTGRTFHKLNAWNYEKLFASVLCSQIEPRNFASLVNIKLKNNISVFRVRCSIELREYPPVNTDIFYSYVNWFALLDILFFYYSND